MTPRTPRQRSAWRGGNLKPASGIPIVTTATILAVGVSAAYVTIVLEIQRRPDLDLDPVVILMAATSAVISIATYPFTTVFGLAALHRRIHAQQARQIKWATISLYIQACAASTFALIAIISLLFVGNDNITELAASSPERAITHEEIFADARNLQAEALQQLEMGNVRGAAKSSWGATKRATDALILARTGQEPTTRSQTSNTLDALAKVDPSVMPLVGPYYIRMARLHYDCFYDGACNSMDYERIRETTWYIREAERLSSE